MIDFDREQLGHTLGAQTGCQIVVEHVTMAARLLGNATLDEERILLYGPGRERGAADEHSALYEICAVGGRRKH